MTQKQKKDFEELLKKIKSLPEAQQKEVNAFAMGLAAAGAVKK